MVVGLQELFAGNSSH